MRKVATATLIVFLATGMLGIIGCGQSTSIDEAKWIKPEQFKVLQEVEKEVKGFVNDVHSALFDHESLAEGSDAVGAVLKDSQSVLPVLGVQRGYGDTPGQDPGEDEKSTWERISPEERKSIENTLTEEILKLRKRYKEKDEEGHEHVDASNAGIVGDTYLNAMLSLYGLHDFQEYILEHTIENGTMLNESNPPDVLNSVGWKTFCDTGAGNPSGVIVQIYQDPSTGRLTYKYKHGAWGNVVEATVLEIERAFITDARDIISEGNDILVEHLKF
ncbi:MAG: hypothetical protein L6427_06335 [Actinomycetia bacterium]|nr:hypothetical protein [Actinomycetes bacterium]